MSSPEHGTIFGSASAVTSAINAVPGGKASAPRQLSPTALLVAAQDFKPAYSPIVVAGTVRLIEAALIIAVGLAIYLPYVVRRFGFEWHYLAAVIGIAGLSMLAFQTADIYQVQAFRGHEKQYMRLASAWSVVFLIVIGISFFAKA